MTIKRGLEKREARFGLRRSQSLLKIIEDVIKRQGALDFLRECQECHTGWKLIPS